MSLASPVALTRNSWALSCNNLPPNIQEKIDNLKILAETASPHTINDLVTALDENDSCVSVSAADALRSIGTGAEDAIHKLVSIAKDPSKNIDLRRTSILALRSIGAEPVLDDLRQLLKNKDFGIRSNAAGALLSLEYKAQKAIPDLEKIIKNSQENWYGQVREDAIQALGQIELSLIQEIGKGSRGKIESNDIDAVSTLREVLVSDPAWRVRNQATDQLGQIAEEAHKNKPVYDSLRDSLTATVPSLQQQLKNANYTLRYNTIITLGKIGEDAKVSVLDLRQALNDPLNFDRDDIRKETVKSLGKIGVASQIAAPEINYLLLEDNSPSVKAAAAEALGKMGAHDNNSIENLIKAINNGNKSVREAAISSLREIATTQTEKITDPTVEAKTTPESSEKDLTQTKAIEQSGKAESEEIAQTVDTKKAQEYLQKAITQMKSLEQSENIDPEEKGNIKIAINDMEQHLASFQATDRERMWSWVVQLLNKLNPSASSNTWEFFGILLFDFVLAVCIVFAVIINLIGFILIRIRSWPHCSKLPLVLLKFYQFWKPFRLRIPNLGIDKIAPYTLLLLTYHPGVLDAWVETHISSVRDKFKQKKIVQDRQVYVPATVMIDDRLVEQLKEGMLRSIFDRYNCLLIWGEGGSGKTSLACQIAQWAMSDKESDRLQKHKMLPVLIQDDLDITQAQPLLHAIQGQLQDLIGDSDSISDELLKHLLRKKRILVIVDSFSEMKEETRRLICPENPDLGIGALIITSRIEETLGHVTKGVLKPLHIRGAGLSSFLDTYLKLQHKRDRLSDQEFFDDCKQLLSSMKEQEPEFTAMLVKLYGERLIDAKTKGESQIISSIPQLMLDYLNKLNENIKENSLKNEDIQADAKAIAWECLKGNYRPTTAKKKNVINALIQLDSHQKDSSAKKLAVDFRLNYLENSLGLIRTIEPAEDEIHFDLNVLAEYLAALHLLENTAFLPEDKHQSLLVKLFAGADILHRNGKFNHEQNEENEWDKLHQKIKTIPDSFLIALQSCYSYLVQKNEQQPELVIKILEQIDKELKQRK